MSAREWTDEELLEFVLDEESCTEAEAAEVRGDAQLAARAAEFAAFLGVCRDVFEPGRDELRARAVTKHVLARTTREDLGWRGDLRLVGGFVGQRLRSSTLLRVAAASLLIHMIAVPSLLAYVMFFAPDEERPLRFSVDPQIPEEIFSEHDGDDLSELPEAVATLNEDELDNPFSDLGPHNAMQWDRYHLRAGVPGVMEGAAHPVARLLNQRAAAFAGLADALEDLPTASGPLERALLAEVLLDRAIRERRIPLGLDAALGALGSERLEAAALARADALGLLDDASAGLLAAARAAAPQDELLAQGLRSGGPLGASWREALAAALASEGLDDAVARHWSTWPR